MNTIIITNTAYRPCLSKFFCFLSIKFANFPIFTALNSCNILQPHPHFPASKAESILTHRRLPEEHFPIEQKKKHTFNKNENMLLFTYFLTFSIFRRYTISIIPTSIATPLKICEIGRFVPHNKSLSVLRRSIQSLPTPYPIR